MSAPDFLPDLKAWLKANSTLAPLHGGRVFFRIPPSPSGWPLLRIYQAAGGAENRGDVPVLYVVAVGIEVWGNSPQMYDQVRVLKTAVETVLNEASAQPLNPPGGGTYLANAAVLNATDAPDPDSGNPRYLLHAQLVVRATNASQH